MGIVLATLAVEHTTESPVIVQMGIGVEDEGRGDPDIQKVSRS